MAEPTVVGRTRVSLIPDTSNFGDVLRVQLPKAVRQPARLAGETAGDEILDGIRRKLASATPTVRVGVDLQDTLALAKLDRLTKARTVKITAEIDDKAEKAAKTKLDKLTADRTISIDFDLDDDTAKKALDKLTADRTINVKVSLDTAAADTALKKLTRDAAAEVDIVPTINDAASKRVETALDKLCKDRVVNIRATVDTRVAANEIQNLIRNRRVRIGADVDTRVAANDLANLTRRRQVGITARADTAAANTALTFLTRDRTMSVRVRTLGLAALTGALGNLGSSGGGAAGIGMFSSRIATLAGAALLATPQLAALGSAIAQMGPLAATAAPAVLTLATAFGAIKLGASGVGDAIKAAFADTSAESKAAATATRQVESAQRNLANAQRGVADAERSLSQAQRAARQAQAELSAARRQATRDLEDMNQRLRQGALDQKQAALDVEQAELDLQKTRTDPAATQLQIQQADLALQRARAAAEEQTRQQKRLQIDTAAANKAGVAGSDAVVQAQERIRAANEQVAEQQRGLEDAHRAVADATRAVADAQLAAATQVSKLDTAIAKLSPNARQFVGVLQAMAPAWRDMRLDVQDALFAGLGTRLQQVGGQILPTVRAGFVGAAGELNLMGRNALTAVSNLEKTGQLQGAFDVVNNGLNNMSRIPGQIVTGLAQLTVAAGPAWDRMTAGAGSAMDRIMAKLSAGLESGALEEAISTALDVAVAFGKVLGDLFGILKNVMGAAADAGGDFFAVIGEALAEIRRITALPEVQAALRSIFTAVQAIATLIAGVLGAVIQAVLPLLAALAPTVTALAQALGPVLARLAEALGQALMPIITALLPVIDILGNALIGIITAITPLLAPIGQLIGAIVTALAPILATVVNVIVQLVSALAGPLTTVITALIPVVELIGKLISDTFKALEPAIKPLIDLVALLAGTFATIFVQALNALLPAITPLIPLFVQIVTILADLLVAILVPLTPVITEMGGLLGQILVEAVNALAPILAAVVGMFAELLPELTPLIPAIVQVVMAVLQLLPPLTQLLLQILTPLMPVITEIATLLVTVLGGALGFLLPIIVTVVGWITGFVKAVSDGVVWIVEKFQWLFDILLGHSIIPDIVNGALQWFSDLRDKAVEIFTWIKDKIVEKWEALWGGIKDKARAAWDFVQKGFDKFAGGLTDAFDKVKEGLGKIWEGIKNLVKSPVKFWIETVYNKGIVSVWNKTAAKIPGVPDLKAMPVPKGFARGGILPGFSTWRDGDDQLVPMRRGEGVYVSEAMRDPYERARLHAVNAAAMAGRSLSQFRGFAEGGIFGGLSDIGSGIASGVSKALGKGADVVRGGLADLAEAAFKPVKSGISKALGADKNTFPGLIGQMPIGLIDKTIDFIRGKDIAEGTGDWLKPVSAPYGTPFGKRGSMWSSGRHTGLDFPAKTGTPVRAVDSGIVRKAVNTGAYGQHIEVNHGGGLSSLYAHMSAMLAKASDTVKRGEQIGRVGATGNTTGPHLHLEARINGQSVDPMRYLEGDTGDTGSGVQRWRGIVQQALGQVGQSLNMVNTTLRRMNQESGGNPRAVNRNDINWVNGTPSVGLMQVIGPTFRAHAGRYKSTGPFMYGVSIDPMANIYASMRYALSRYGSLSAAYDRRGGYALGGIVGGGTLISRGRRGGYAAGGVIRVGGKNIDTGPIAASIGGTFLQQLSGTASQIDAAMTKVADALKTAFKGVKTTLDDKLLKQVATQNTALKKLADQRDKIRATITQATDFAKETSGNAANFTSLTGLPNSGQPFGTEGIISGLKVRLGQLNAFSKNVATLGKRGLSKELLGQIIQAGPDQGAPYAAALVKATDAQLRDLNAVQAQIGKAATGYGQAAANAMYDAGTQSGQGFLSGLKAQEKAITDAMSSLARKIQDAIKKALKIKSPSQVFAQLGQFTVQGFARGMQAATPQAAAAAASMARMVRSTTAANVSRTDIRQTQINSDRHLHYTAAVREVASRRSILDALAMDDMLHRPAMTGA
jgi:phage-related protein